MMLESDEIERIEALASKIVGDIIREAHAAGRSVRILEGNDVVDWYPDGKKVVIKTLPAIHYKLKSPQFSIK